MNFRNFQLVQFSDKEFGVRKGWVFHRYYDFKNFGYWWDATSPFFKNDCRACRVEAVRVYERLTTIGPKGKVVKP